MTEACGKWGGGGAGEGEEQSRQKQQYLQRPWGRNQPGLLLNQQQTGPWGWREVSKAEAIREVSSNPAMWSRSLLTIAKTSHFI